MSKMRWEKTLYARVEERIELDLIRYWRELKVIDMEGGHMDNTCYCCNIRLNMFDTGDFDLHDNNLRLFEYNDSVYNVCLECYRRLNIDDNINTYIKRLRNNIEINNYDDDIADY